MAGPQIPRETRHLARVGKAGDCCNKPMRDFFTILRRHNRSWVVRVKLRTRYQASLS